MQNNNYSGLINYEVKTLKNNAIIKTIVFI